MDYFFSISIITLSRRFWASGGAAFTVNSATVIHENIDIVPIIVDDSFSYIPWGGDNL